MEENHYDVGALEEYQYEVFGLRTSAAVDKHLEVLKRMYEHG